jgi:mannosyltransferase
MLSDQSGIELGKAAHGKLLPISPQEMRAEGPSRATGSPVPAQPGTPELAGDAAGHNIGLRAALRRLRLLYPNFKFVQTGVSTSVFSLSRALAGMGVDVTVIGTKPSEGWNSPACDASAVPVWHARRNIEMLAGLIVRRFSPRTKLVFTSAAQRVHTAYTNWLMSRMDIVVATSRASASFVDRECVVVPHGIDTQLYTPADRASLKQRIGLDPAASYLGSFGALRPSKGTDIFVDALIATLHERPAWKAVVVGHIAPNELAFAAELKGRIAAADLSDRIVLSGHLADARDHLRAMDICVAPSREEGFGLTALEAMSSEVAVVATRAGSYADTILDGETGLLVDIGDVAALAGAMAALMDNATRRQLMGESGRRHVLASHGVEREAEALLEVYLSLAGLRGEDGAAVG